MCPCENHGLPWHENIVFRIKKTSFVHWKTIYLYLQIATTKITRNISTCIKIHQTSVLHGPWRRKSPSTLKMVLCRSFHLLTIPINKQDLSGIKSLKAADYDIYSFLSHQTPIQSQPQQNKTINNYQYPFELTFPIIKLSIHLQHQNHTPNLSLTLILTTNLIFLFLFYFTLFLNLEDL